MKELCKHFGICGGCDFQDVKYEEQLKAKEARLKNIFSAFTITNFESIAPSPEIFYYRNKMEYAVNNDRENIVIGLRQKKRFYRIVDLEECRIFLDGVKDIFAVFKDWMKANGIEPYQLKRHTGNIRYAAMRHSKYYNELMIIIVMASEEDSPSALVDRLKSIKAVRSIYLCVNSGLSDVSIAGKTRLMHGESHIRERINNIDYLIGPGSFFQTNPYCCGELYSIIKDQVKHNGRQALDMCCGAGGITLQVADNFDKVVGVDISAQNIEDAITNAKINKIENLEFICDDAQNFLLNSVALKSAQAFSTIILDPPRAGLSKKAREAVCSSGVENVVYVSCNPVNLAEDLKTLTAAYNIEKMIPVDMFPHTRHVEVVAILKRSRV
ncbi:MAG: 23S rRNA (uracil(1939)-C(5))-methyltransferase RlmD [Candidatus Omnitrophota bacterium]|nr:23S rRNA (uracil(1939)-C(5))-methyltransferase RlmD [Candidatus Omnitrophota bacterium]